MTGRGIGTSSASLRLDHRPAPAWGTWRSADGRRADPLKPRDYPITADCEGCGRKVGSAALAAGWEHL